MTGTLDELKYEITRKFDRYKIIENKYGRMSVLIKVPFIDSNLVESIQVMRTIGVVYHYQQLSFWECRIKKQQVINKL